MSYAFYILLREPAPIAIGDANPDPPDPEDPLDPPEPDGPIDPPDPEDPEDPPDPLDPPEPDPEPEPDPPDPDESYCIVSFGDRDGDAGDNGYDYIDLAGLESDFTASYGTPNWSSQTDWVEFLAFITDAVKTGGSPTWLGNLNGCDDLEAKQCAVAWARHYNYRVFN